ncbi:MAG TPA: bacteriohopanetetrol glucosamine biosynthesis glycosyltransferase HpnI [Terriglobia bacterium]|nr:bacteriohopanetetrol glucosamine biosynthesis glycosyltransferase HpnI [Terriglobia bacterium]
MSILLQALLFIAASSGIAYCFLAFWTAIRFHLRNREASDRNFTPPASILKPLCGLDPHGYESLRSHCIQDYPEYEIIFGVSRFDDPAVPAVERLIQEFPNLSIRLVVCPNVFGMNFKVSNLLQMLPAARHPYLVINDSDICVPRNYLSLVIGPLEDRSVGIVTCLYRGIAGPSIGSRLESLAIEADFIPGVLCARQLEKGIHFAMGSTMAFRREVLKLVEGLRSIADYLADDYEFGRRVSNAGLRVELADCIVEHYLPGYSWSEFFQHQLRWARTIRSCRPEGYAALILTLPLPWSVFALAAAPSMRLGWIFVIVSLVLRLMVMFASGFLVLRNRQVFRNLWLLPIRDFVSLLIWVLSYAGNGIVWRGNKFELANGKLRSA